ncbi:flavin reductase [Streptomyces tateyamensis]|uniref:Flavin reductase n=1 Tax=Streptomyces tateyamensis TaxID=565073 RepID=A0A2V4NJB2_9ACTN|nr:flavin reductase family protein [Streptomyces tateyamensis]PYC79568.1 flavin reductase [Streptomyces tateyamensis]
MLPAAEAPQVELVSRVSREGFRQAFRHYPAGVVVVTADAGRGPVGFTATSLSSLSLDPPLISFGIATGSSSWPHLRDATTAVVNFLGADQEPLARRFATSGIDRFAAPTSWHRLPGGEPALDGTSGRLTVRIEQLVTAGDHRLVLARVEEISLAHAPQPLLYHDGRYHPLPSAHTTTAERS